MMRRLLGIAIVVGLSVAPALAQGRGAPSPDAIPERVPRAEVLRLFDAFAVVQAQEALGLDNARYGTFVSAYKSLLETRRRQREQRIRLVNELGRLAQAGSPDEGVLRDRLKALQDHDARAASEAAQALEGVDQALTVEQRARFRVFEERMEQRKLELLARARAVRERRGQQPQ
jgi:hypothetical protein